MVLRGKISEVLAIILNFKPPPTSSFIPQVVKTFEVLWLPTTSDIVKLLWHSRQILGILLHGSSSASAHECGFLFLGFI